MINNLKRILLSLVGASLILTSTTEPVHSQSASRASWYGRETCRANGTIYGSTCRTANGDLFNENHLTAASCQYSFGTRLRVTNLNNSRSVIVRVNDTGGFCRRGRVDIDLSRGAMQQLQGINAGIIPVRIERE